MKQLQSLFCYKSRVRFFPINFRICCQPYWDTKQAQLAVPPPFSSSVNREIEALANFGCHLAVYFFLSNFQSQHLLIVSLKTFLWLPKTSRFGMFEKIMHFNSEKLLKSTAIFCLTSSKTYVAWYLTRAIKHDTFIFSSGLKKGGFSVTFYTEM